MSHEAQTPPGAKPGAAFPRFHPAANVALLALLSYGFLVAVPLVRGVPPEVGVIGGSLLFAALCLGMVGAGAALVVSWATEAALAAGFLAAWGLMAQLGPNTDWARLYLGPAANVCFLLACLFVGKLLSRIVRERALALPVAIVAGLADIFTVFWGPTGEALQHAPQLVQRLSLAIPEAGSAAGEQGAQGLAYVAAIGLGDFIFLALFMALAVRFGFNASRTFWAMLAGAVIGILLALNESLGLPGMPLLPYMGAGFIIANAREFRLSRTELRDLCIALGVLVALLAVAAVTFHRPPEPSAGEARDAAAPGSAKSKDQDNASQATPAGTRAEPQSEAVGADSR